MKRNLTPFTNEPSLEFKYWRLAFSFSPACYWDGLSFLVVSFFGTNDPAEAVLWFMGGSVVDFYVSPVPAWPRPLLLMGYGFL